MKNCNQSSMSVPFCLMVIHFVLFLSPLTQNRLFQGLFKVLGLVFQNRQGLICNLKASKETCEGSF